MFTPLPTERWQDAYKTINEWQCYYINVSSCLRVYLIEKVMVGVLTQKHQLYKTIFTAVWYALNCLFHMGSKTKIFFNDNIVCRNNASMVLYFLSYKSMYKFVKKLNIRNIRVSLVLAVECFQILHLVRQLKRDQILRITQKPMWTNVYFKLVYFYLHHVYTF